MLYASRALTAPPDPSEPPPDPSDEAEASYDSPDPSEPVASPEPGDPSQPPLTGPAPSEAAPSEPAPVAAASHAAVPHPLTHATEQAAREHAYEQEFEIPPAPAVPDPPGRQNIFNRPIANPEWDAMEIINTDRPDFTDVLPTVKKYMWQTESGYSFSMRERGGESPYSYFRHRVPETLIRYGLTERLELRVRWDSAFYTHRTGSANLEPGVAFSGEFTVGVKWQAILQDGWKPAHSFMAVLSARGSDGNVTHTGFEPGLNWIYGWQVRKFMVLRGSTGFEYVAQLAQPSDGDPPIGTLGSLTVHQSVVAYLQWLPRLGSYSEWFSFYDFGYDRGAQQNLGQGFYIYLTPNVQIDLRVAGTVAAFGDRFRDLTMGGGLSLRGFYHRQRRVPHERASKEPARLVAGSRQRS